MGGLEESTGDGAAKVGGNASLTGASNDMSSRKKHLFKKNNRYPKNVKKHVLVAGEKRKRKKKKKKEKRRQIIILIKVIIIITNKYIYMQRNSLKSMYQHA